MSNKNGLFFVLEGSDGSGKTTQFKLLAERLRAIGHEVDVYDFPRYSQPSSYFVKRYLNGEYGPASEISPFTASLFFALDRFETAPKIRQSISEGKIVLANRYAGSNMAHQGSKFTNTGEQRGFFVWADSLEFQLLGIPRPTLNLFLRVPAEISYELIKRKQARSYTSKTHDEHESDIEHLRKSVSTYDTLCQLFPKDYKPIDCSKGGKILPVPDINNKIWQILQPILPKPAHRGHPVTINLDEDKKPSGSKGSHHADQIASERTPIEIKDISLAAASDICTSPGIKFEYNVKWPSSDNKPRLSYYVPSGLGPKLSDKYHNSMKKIAALHLQMLTAVNDYAKKEPLAAKKAKQLLKNIAPLAALSDLNLTLADDGFQLLSEHIANSYLPEVQQVAKRLDHVLVSPMPSSGSTAPESLKQVIRQLIKSPDMQNLSNTDEPVRLVDISPRNEIELVADTLYQSSSLSKSEIIAELDQVPYIQKAETLKAAIAQKPSILLKKIKYTFDVIESISLLEELDKFFVLTDLQLQPSTPRYGYAVPKELETVGIDERYIQCFDVSLNLYSEIQAAGYDNIAGYAVLYGHKARWQFSCDAESILKRYDAASPYLKKFQRQLQEKISVAHPLVSSVALGIYKKHPSDAKPHIKPAAHEKGVKKSDSRSRK